MFTKKRRIKLVLLALVFLASSCNTKPMLEVGSSKLNVEVADTKPTRDQGLGGRTQLAANEGMYFIFEKPDRYSFWMKDMQFALDFIWVKGGKVVEITPSVQPQIGKTETELTKYIPQQAIDAVLEVNAGWAATNQIKVGDSVRLTQ